MFWTSTRTVLPIAMLVMRLSKILAAFVGRPHG
jgi:hypothetical protein